MDEKGERPQSNLREFNIREKMRETDREVSEACPGHISP